MPALSVKYRPKEFEDVCSQSSIIKILKRQLELKQYSNCYLFSGFSGTGKTTLARIFATKINNGEQGTIEIDGASNNGVDNIRNIIESAKERSLVSEYKIYIVDEAHMITTAGWNSFLKTLEEPPVHTIFIFCTTNPEKLPITIQNRLMKFNLSRISIEEIKSRLDYICEQENIINYKEAIDYIAKISNGSLRNAISNLEKCINYNKDLNINNVLECLGNFSYTNLFELTNAIIDGSKENILKITNNIYLNGDDINYFIDLYLTFILDLINYCLFKDLNLIKIPSYMKKDLDYTIKIENNSKYFTWLSNQVLNIKNTIKQDINSKTTVEIMLLNLLK